MCVCFFIDLRESLISMVLFCFLLFPQSIDRKVTCASVRAPVRYWSVYYALINVKRDPSPMGRVTGLGGDSIDFRLPGKGVFERTRGRLGDCPCACAVFTRVRTTKPYVV